MKKCLFIYLFFLFSILTGFAGMVEKTGRPGFSISTPTFKSFKLSAFSAEQSGKDRDQDLFYRSGHTTGPASVQQFLVTAIFEPALLTNQNRADNINGYKELRQREYLFHLFPSHFFW